MYLYIYVCICIYIHIYTYIYDTPHVRVCVRTSLVFEDISCLVYSHAPSLYLVSESLVYSTVLHRQISLPPYTSACAAVRIQRLRYFEWSC